NEAGGLLGSTQIPRPKKIYVIRNLFSFPRSRSAELQLCAALFVSASHFQAEHAELELCAPNYGLASNGNRAVDVCRMQSPQCTAASSSTHGHCRAGGTSRSRRMG